MALLTEELAKGIADAVDAVVAKANAPEPPPRLKRPRYSTMCLLSTRPADETRFRSHFPGRLRHLRQHLGLTQKLFAEWLGVSRSFLSEVEHGRSNPSMIMLARLIGAVLEDRRGVPHLISRPWILSGEGAIFERLAGPEGRD